MSYDDFFEAALEAVATEQARDRPLDAPASEQTTAPADSPGSTSLVNGAAFPNLLAFATETGLVSDEDGVLTVDLNLFAFRAALSPQFMYRQSEYKKYETLRRFGGSLSFGGKGESFDRDGDGQADPVLEAKELGDIVNWELRWRFSGSRDRRDEENVKKFYTKTDAQSALDSTKYAEFFNKHKSTMIARESTATRGCLDRARMEEWVQDPAIARELLDIAKASKALDVAVEAAAAEIDSSPVWSLFTGGVSRGDQFGPDSVKAGLRGTMGDDDNGYTFNLEWSQTDGLNGAKDPTQLKAGLEYARLAMRGIALTREAAQNGVRLSLSGSYEKFWDVPGANHDTTAKLNAKLELPLTANVKIPISVTWANHNDLIEGEDEIRGHIGFSLDLSPLRSAIKP